MYQLLISFSGSLSAYFYSQLATELAYCMVESAASYVTIMLFARFVLGSEPKKIPLLIMVFLTLIPVANLLFPIPFIAYLVDYYDLLMLCCIWLSFPQIKLRYLFAVFAFISCSISVVSYFAVNTFLSIPAFAELIINLICLLIWNCIFLSKLRHKIREVLYATPTGVLISCTVILLVMVLMNNFLSRGGSAYQIKQIAIDMGFEETASMYGAFTPEELEYAYNFFDQLYLHANDFYVLILQLVLCTALPLYMIFFRTNHQLKAQNANFEQQIQAQAEHYRNLAEANAEVRRFKHDFKNVRFAIEQLLSEGRKQEALNVMQEFSEALNSNSRQMLLFDTGNGIADALLTDKLHKAHQKQTTLSFKGAIAGSALAPTDLCVLLGNSIDNAIEACEKLPPEMERKITVECQCSSGFMFLTIQNPIHKKVAVCDNHVPTSKTDNALHGFGISSMHKVAKKYDGTVKLDSNDGFFTVNIELCLPAASVNLAG